VRRRKLAENDRTSTSSDNGPAIARESAHEDVTPGIAAPLAPPLAADGINRPARPCEAAAVGSAEAPLAPEALLAVQPRLPPLAAPAVRHDAEPTPDHDSADATDILIVVHQAHSTPGRIGERLERRGYRLDVRRPALGDPLPGSLESYAGAVVFGGPMSANDDRPFIRAEIDFIAQALKEEAPVLGICLGAQMMAKALGAQVSPHHEGTCEIGYYPLAATDQGAALLPWPSHVYHWHSEGFELPPGAELLARGEVFPNQAFRYGESAFGLQFHPEVTREMMCLWTVRGAHNLSKRGAQPGEAHLAGWSRYDAAVCRWLDGFLDVWLKAERAAADASGREPARAATPAKTSR